VVDHSNTYLNVTIESTNRGFADSMLTRLSHNVQQDKMELRTYLPSAGFEAQSQNRAWMLAVRVKTEGLYLIVED